MWIARKYKETLEAMLRQFPAVVLTGARQVGKTSLARRVLPDAAYVPLDLPSLAARAEQSSADFLRATAARVGGLLSFSELARDVGISPNTARQWLSVLQASGQIMLLEPYHRNIGKRLVKTPKLYFCDTGLAVFLQGFESWQAVARHPVVGQLWENHVVMEVARHYASQGRDKPLWFWRTAHGEEVDLLVEEAGRFIAIEAKFTENPEPTVLRGVNALIRACGQENVTASIVACRTPHAYPLREGATAVPGSRIGAYLDSSASA